MDPALTTTAPPKQRRFTVEEYHQMGAAGILSEDDPVELLEGHIYVMSPIGSQHAACVRRLTRLFVQRADPQALVSTQNPIFLTPESEPEPDVALLSPREDDYATRHPRPDEVLLVIKVADSSRSLDRTVKLPLYARAGIPEVWIIALDNDRADVYREPEGDQYSSHETKEPDDDVLVSALPELDPVSVRTILGT